VNAVTAECLVCHAPATRVVIRTDVPKSHPRDRYRWHYCSMHCPNKNNLYNCKVERL
jgi:hypothetical protein